jgi:ketosteroid isomerase-like protein
MKRNISVFILLILLASSFKYRTKAREVNQNVITAGYSSTASQKSFPVESFNSAIEKLQQANSELSKGNPDLAKSMWSHKEDVTIFDEKAVGEIKGWQAVEATLNATSKQLSKESTYTFEKIASHEAGDQGYLLQKEHYKLANGRVIDLHVTVLFRKEANSWKIIHRQSDLSALARESDKSSK